MQPAGYYWVFNTVSTNACSPKPFVLAGDRDIWRESKAKGAKAHPRRQMMVEGGGDVVHKIFLKSPEYMTYKADQGEGFNDIGRTTFLTHLSFATSTHT